MAYEKQTWVNGEVITAEKLNHIEDGIGSGGIVFVTFERNEETMILHASYNDILSIIDNGSLPVLLDVDENFKGVYVFTSMDYDPDPELGYIAAFGADYTFHADSPDINMTFNGGK